MTTPPNPNNNEKIGWVEAALILVLVVTVVIVILGLLGPVIVNLTIIPWITATLATVSGFMVKNALMLGLLFIGLLITVFILYLSNRR